MDYDGLNRLTTASGSWGEGEFRYDSVGNIKLKSLGSQVFNYNYDSENRLATVSGAKSYVFQYDPRGNVLHNGLRDFSYNLDNQMMSSEGIGYEYDGHNRRVLKNISGNVEYSVYNIEGKLLYEEKSNGDRIEYLYLGGQVVAILESR